MDGQVHSTGNSIKNRLEFETLISDLSSKFINLNPCDVDSEIQESLGRVCVALKLDYAVLWQWSERNPAIITPTHFFPAEIDSPPPEPLNQESYPWHVEQMLAGRMIATSSLEELPPEAAVDRESGRLLGIKSNLCLPLLMAGEQPVGALALNTLHSRRDWPDHLIDRLKLVAQMFANALARNRSMQILRENQERLALAADSAGAGLWTLDFDTRVFWATERGRAIFGYKPDEVIDFERFQASIHPDDRSLVVEAIERSMQVNEPINLEYRITLSGDDSERWIASLGRPQLGAAGTLERLTGASIDISEQKVAEEELRASEARLAAGADLAGLGFYEGDFNAGVLTSDDLMRDLCGIPPERTAGLQGLEFWLEHLHPEELPRVLTLRDQLHDGRLDRFSLEYRYLHPVRGERWIQHLAGVRARDTTGRAVHTFGVLRDITDRKRVEAELRDLSRRLISAHEEERALLARELHDDLTQRVAVLAIEAGGIELSVSDEKQVKAMQSIREGLIRLSEDIHSLAYQLHPSVLDELGLAEALRVECDRLLRRSSFQISLELEPLPASVGRDEALCLFRVTQEALNNVGRHADAQNASVSLQQVDGGLLLAICDDGVGFNPKNPRNGRSLGLASMRERVRLLNGTIDIESTPHKGTAIIAWVPVDGVS